MKIALITPYKNFAGGVESVNKNLIDIFTINNWNVDLITTDDFIPNFMDKVLIKIIGLPYITSKKFKSIKTNYDIVIANGEFAFGIDHPKTINLFHGSYLGYRNYLKETIKLKSYLGLTKNAFIQKIGSKNKYVVAVSAFVKEILEKQGIRVNKVISNSVDTKKFTPKSLKYRKNYIFVGSYNYYAKGFDILEQISKKGLDIYCVTNKKPNFPLKWVKNVPNKEMPDIYNNFKILIFPSRFEGMPMAPLEAMACGLPVVMSNVGLGIELKREIPEFVIDTYDADLFYKRILEIEENYEYFSKKARGYVKKYHSLEKYKEEWIKFIREVINES